MQNKYDIFISYSRKDSSMVQPMVNSLKKSGIEVWLDVSNIDYGVTFPDRIAKAIDESDSVLFVCSKNSLSSDFCKKELGYARRNNKEVRVILLDGTMPKRGWFALVYQDVNCVDYTKIEQREGLLEELKTKYASTPATPQPIVPPPPPPVTSSTYFAKYVKYGVWLQTAIFGILLALCVGCLFKGKIKEVPALLIQDVLLAFTLGGMIWSTQSIKKHKFCRWSFLVLDVIALALLISISMKYYDISLGYRKGAQYGPVYYNLRSLGYSCKYEVPLVVGVFGALYVIHNACVLMVMYSRVLWNKIPQKIRKSIR